MRLFGAAFGTALACVGAAAWVTAASAGDPPTRTYANYVRVGDFGSNGPPGCGGAVAVSGGFANELDRRTSRMFLFGFNSTAGFPELPGGPTWRVTVANLGSADHGAGYQRTFVYCGDRRTRLRLVEARVRIRPSRTATATVTCPRGTEAVSGGFADEGAGTQGALVFGFRSRRVGTRSWRASAINTSGSIASRLIVQANCDRARPRLAALSRTIEVPAGRARATAVDCGEGRKAWSAGFESSVTRWPRGGAYPYLFKRVAQRSWRAAAFSTGPAAKFTLHVYCGG